MRLIIIWIANVVALFLAAYLLPGIGIGDEVALAIAAAVLGIVNLVVKPLVKLLTLPITLLTLGLFTFVIDALFILLVGELVVGFDVAGFLDALLAALIVGVVNSLMTKRR